jgi:TnpA family transposase
MPVQFLTTEQRNNYGRYVGEPNSVDLARYFHLNDTDYQLINNKRGDHNRLGFGLQLTTVRYLGRFSDETEVPTKVLDVLMRQLGIVDIGCLIKYNDQRQRLRHIEEICQHYGYQEFNEPLLGFRFARWLYEYCWTGTERPSILFERATTWLLANKVLLPGASVLERFIARLQQRVEKRLWKYMSSQITEEQQIKLEALLLVPAGSRRSWFDQLRASPIRISGPSLVQALERLEKVRSLGIVFAIPNSVPLSRLSTLARFAAKAKVTAIIRLPRLRRLATLAAFMQTLEASAQDDALDILNRLLHEIFGQAIKAGQKARLRNLRDLDATAMTLADACKILMDTSLPDGEVREAVFNKFSRDALAQTIENTYALTRPPDDVFYSELQVSYRRIRLFLPKLLKNIHFIAAPAGKQIVAAWDYLRQHYNKRQFDKLVPLDIVNKTWRRYVLPDKKTVDPQAYIFCVLDQLRTALKRRDIFVTPSWRYTDPRNGLLAGSEWEAAKPMICRTLGYSADPKPVLNDLAIELDKTYCTVASRLSSNSALRFEGDSGKEELILSPLEKNNEPESLIALRTAISERIPKVDLTEILLEITARTGFTDAFTHISEQTARASDISISLCAVMLAEACNTGIEPLIRQDTPVLRRDRLIWVSQNYFRDETLMAANAKLVAAQNSLKLAHIWGGGEVASADGLRFIVPVKTIHADSNPKYFGIGRGVTYYNLVSDQFTGLHAITVPGTLRDSLVLLSVVLEQETELQPIEIMTDTGAYSDVVFGLFRLLGYRFSPRLADIGGTRFWRIDRDADYGLLNNIARQRINIELIAKHWDDLLRLAGSLKLGRVSPTTIMRTLHVGDRPTRLAQALAEFGRIDKTLHALNYIDDEDKRRSILTQLNRGEGRHSLARNIFHGKRGELRQRYREGQEEQLGTLGLVVNIIILWNTIYIDAVLDQLKQEGYNIKEEDVVRLSPLIHDHINMLGRYSFSVPASVAKGELRPLRDPSQSD